MATFNLFNYLEPPNACYEFERIYSAEQWQKKQQWITDYLAEYHPDIIGFQEVFSPESLKALVSEQGYDHFAVIDEPHVVDDFIYSRPVVAIASRYPIVESVAVSPNIELAQTLGLTDDFSFSRKVIRATIDVPHLGQCDCYVVHFKSKRTMIELNESDFTEKGEKLSPEKTIIETLKAQVAGGWGSTIQRGSEAALLMIEMIARREQTNKPMVLMGDFNNTLSDGVLTHLLTNSLRFVSTIDRDIYLAKYCLQDSWDLYQAVKNAEQIGIEENIAEQDNTQINVDTIVDANQSVSTVRNPTHYFGVTSSVLDYILLSCDFDAGYHDSLYEVSDYHTYDRHLINPLFDRDGESTDHGVVLITLTLRS
ncbi:endonuclease/exonuclease/phosphatase family protein [Colwellia sp. E2M01]|nr:endonuclease/exonuclease/phosphatase family protein [Colwellia sp. E2M01]